MKLYIIGPVGSGKTTLAQKLSQKYAIPHYELDKIVWNDTIGVKRTKEEQTKLLNNILKKKSWIIEDVGRSIFEEAYDKCDYIYYIKLSKITLYYRVTTRWLKQLLKLEKSNYKQNLSTLKQMLSWVNSSLKKEPTIISSLNKYKCFKIITKKDIKKLHY